MRAIICRGSASAVQNNAEKRKFGRAGIRFLEDVSPADMTHPCKEDQMNLSSPSITHHPSDVVNPKSWRFVEPLKGPAADQRAKLLALDHIIISNAHFAGVRQSK